jgi:hypothetical protein
MCEHGQSGKGESISNDLDQKIPHQETNSLVIMHDEARNDMGVGFQISCIVHHLTEPF